MMLLKNLHDVNALVGAVAKCKGDVLLRSVDGSEEFNLKSTLSQYIGISRLCEEKGDQYEIFCMDRSDEGRMMQFFHDIKTCKD